eukprot:m.55110 g.55110  ORF g.55110 m.55110 type:complete len:89 (-) comp22023_c0_seq1:82-348(-)
MTKAERVDESGRIVPKTKTGFFPTSTLTDLVLKMLEGANEDCVPVKIEIKEKKLLPGDLEKSVEKFEGYTVVVQTDQNEEYRFKITTS